MSDKTPAAPARKTVVSPCRVSYRMTDQMGVVYYANYLELFEIGRANLLRDTGLTYRQMEEQGYRLPVVHASCDYHAPARYDDLLEVCARVERLTRVRVDFCYEIRRPEDHAVICTGQTRHAVVGLDGRPRRLDPLWMERLDA